SRVASFLVLENENDYKRFNIEDERGKTVPGGDLGLFMEETWHKLGAAISPKEAFQRFLAQIQPKIMQLSPADQQKFQALIASLGDDDFNLPAEERGPALMSASDLANKYLRARSTDRRDANAYLDEARRRGDLGDSFGAMRVLSSVVEEYPG